MPLLAQLGYRVWAPNLRGYGATDSPREVAAYKTNTLVADVAALIKVANPKETLLIAHDWGAALPGFSPWSNPNSLTGWWSSTCRILPASVANCAD